jgi:hypothetical protein
MPAKITPAPRAAKPAQRITFGVNGALVTVVIRISTLLLMMMIGDEVGGD